jgi:hypothetical protein
MGNTIFDKLAEKYPFITLCSYANAEYVGIIQNRDDSVTTIYDFGSVVDQQDKMLFLELANQWWWESNRSIPINIFLKHTWSEFRYSLVTLNVKDIKEQQGHVVCLANLANKRTKRRVVQLVRRLG